MWSFCFLFKIGQKEKEREVSSTLCTVFQGLCKYIPAPLPQADWEAQDGCPHALYFLFSMYVLGFFFLPNL